MANFRKQFVAEERKTLSVKLSSPEGKRLSQAVMPVELVRKCLYIAELRHRTISTRALPAKIWAKRNAIAVVMLPEAHTVLAAATSAFKIRLFLWAIAGIALALAVWLTWWLIFLVATAVIAERAMARKEHQFWVFLGATLLAAEMLVIDFAGWGCAYPVAQQAALEALGGCADADDYTTEWLDYYLPCRYDLDANVLAWLGPAGTGDLREISLGSK